MLVPTAMAVALLATVAPASQPVAANADSVTIGASAALGCAEVRGPFAGGNAEPAAFTVKGAVCTGSVSGRGARVDLRTVAIAINVYNQNVVGQILDPHALQPLIRPGDVFVLVTGNSSGSPDLSWIASAATALHQVFSHNEIRVLTSGQTNIEQLALNHAQIPSYISDVGYDYEPGRANEPEFAWDFPTTVDNFTTAGSEAHTAGYQLFGAPTGRALLQTSLLQYGWNYARLPVSAAGQIVQLQTYCKSGASAQYLAAVTKLRYQANASAVPLGRFFPQVTVDSNANPNVNGVTPDQAIACAQQAADQGFSRISLWWGSDNVTDAQTFLQLLNR
jgi:hypothetical protein